MNTKWKIIETVIKQYRAYKRFSQLNAMNKNFKSKLPLGVSFSFSRTIEDPAIDIWKGQEADVAKAQKSSYRREKCNVSARHGEYDASLEKKTHGQNG